MLRRVDKDKHQWEFAACIHQSRRLYSTAAGEARNRMQHSGSGYLLFAKILQQFQMKRPAMPLIRLTEVNRNLYSIAR